MISNANRANVSIYAVDAAGLRAESSDSQTGRALTRLGQARARTAASQHDPFGSMMQDLERNEELMRSNPDSALGDLASETGGALISNTNNPGPKFRQVDEDLHSYYLLTYTPKNSHYDGRFRQISVKVNRSGIDVQARKGYYALNNSYGTPVLDYEAPALADIVGCAAAQLVRQPRSGLQLPRVRPAGSRAGCCRSTSQRGQLCRRRSQEDLHRRLFLCRDHQG